MEKFYHSLARARSWLPVFLLLTLPSACQKAPPNIANSPTRPAAPDHEAAPAAPPSPSPTNPAAAANPGENEADPIGDVLSADLTAGETSSRLLALLSSTPADDRAFVVQLAGNYCPDEEYWRLLPFLLDRTLSEECRDELMRDVLRRPDAIRLRPLYRLAMDPTHPLCQEAKEYLFSYLQDVPENDFSALAREVEKAEKENR